MKKINYLFILCFVLVVAGCSGGTKKTTCTLDNGQQKYTFIYSSKGDKVVGVEQISYVEYKAYNLTKEEMENNPDKYLPKDDRIKVKFEDKGFTTTTTYNEKDLQDKTLATVAGEGSLKKAIENSKAIGQTCK